MTIEQAPSTNGRTAAEQRYAPPATPPQHASIEHRIPARRRPGLLRLVMPMFFAVAVALVVRGFTRKPGDANAGSDA